MEKSKLFKGLAIVVTILGFGLGVALGNINKTAKLVSESYSSLYDSDYIPSYSYEFNYTLLIECVIGGLVLALIIYWGALMLENLEKLNSKFSISNSPSYRNSNLSNIEPIASVKTSEETPKNYWKCSQCGRVNANYVGTCGCGKRKP